MIHYGLLLNFVYTQVLLIVTYKYTIADRATFGDDYRFGHLLGKPARERLQERLPVATWANFGKPPRGWKPLLKNRMADTMVKAELLLC